MSSHNGGLWIQLRSLAPLGLTTLLTLGTVLISYGSLNTKVERLQSDMQATATTNVSVAVLLKSVSDLERAVTSLNTRLEGQNVRALEAKVDGMQRVMDTRDESLKITQDRLLEMLRTQRDRKP